MNACRRLFDRGTPAQVRSFNPRTVFRSAEVALEAMMIMDREHDSGRLLDRPRPHHYELAHIAVRRLCAHDPLRFFVLMGGETQRDFVEWIWKSVEDHVGSPASGMSPDELEITTCRIGGFPAILVGMPVPRAATEAHAVAVVLTGASPRGEAMPEKPAFRYFTLECGRTLDGSIRTVLCEWVGDTHTYYGDGPEPSLEAFSLALHSRIQPAGAP